jgi:TM2 domain-containing membrane protein YozV
MKNVLLIIFVFLLLWNKIIFPQNLFTVKNRTAFGNYLFCEKDYLRAIDEFSFVLEKKWSDTLQFKIGAAYYAMEQYSNAIIEFSKINKSSSLYLQGNRESLRSLYHLENYSLLRQKADSLFRHEKLPEFLRIKNVTFLLDDSGLPSKQNFLSPFGKKDKQQLSLYYNWKKIPPYKSPITAAIISAVIPGSGKIYAGEVGDGITAFLLTGLFTYLAVDKFQNNYNTSAWIYTGLAAFFYAGNIYGSAAAVQNYNAGIRFNFDKEVKVFINKRNHFMNKAKFLCK